MKDFYDRFRSEETRIGIHHKLELLHEFAAHVYEDREEPFQWNLCEFFELKGIHWTLPSAAAQPEDTGEGPLHEENRLRSDLAYTVNDFVAVNGEECTTDMQIWIDQILETMNNLDGVTTELLLRWYELYDRRKPWKGQY